MDQMLKGRQLSSASARRKRIQERQDERELAFRRYDEHRKRVLHHIALQEEEGEESEYSEEEDTTEYYDRESSVETPSEYSVVTPDDTPAQYSIFDPSVITRKAPPSIHIERLGDKNRNDVPIIKAPISPRLNLQASLISVSDFNYGRFSVMPGYGLDSMSAQDVDTDLDEPYTPIETARPIAFCLPKSRPAVISITNGSQRKKRPMSIQSRLSATDVATPEPTSRSSNRLSQMGFLACEATPFEIPDAPTNAISMMDDAEYEPVPPSAITQLDRTISHKVHANVATPSKTRSSKMSAIKTFIRSPSQANSPIKSSTSRPGSRGSRPSTSAADTGTDIPAFETVPTSLLGSLPRPRTSSAQVAQNYTQANVGQSSARVLPDFSTSINQQETEADALRKKSMVIIKKRRENFSQAFKSSSSRNPHGAQFDVQRSPVSTTPRTGFSNEDFDFSSRYANGSSRRSGALFTGFNPVTPTFNQPVGLGLKI